MNSKSIDNMEIHNTHLYRKYNESVAIHSMFRYKKAMYSSMWTEKPNMGTRWDRFNRTQWRQLIVLTTNILKLKSVPSPVERGSPKSGASTEDCLSAQRTGRIDAHHLNRQKDLNPRVLFIITNCVCAGVRARAHVCV